MEPGNYLLRLGEHSRSTEVAATITLDEEAVTRRVTNVLMVDQPLDELCATKKTGQEAKGILLNLSATDCVTVDNVSKAEKTVVTLVPEGGNILLQLIPIHTSLQIIVRR